jgi:ParB-like chromosome segregation protein Spo0J
MGYGEGGGNVVRWSALYESIEKDGFNEEFPIVVMLRKENNEDQVEAGHHRLDIAIKLGLETVPVRFIIDEIG